MTHDAPTLEQVMDGFNRDQRELVDTPLGRMERWCAETMLIGTTKGMLNVYDTIRADAATEAARADAEQARVALLKDVHKKLDALTARVDAIASELETFKAKERADAQAEEERQRQLADDPLEDPPSDILEYQARNPPTEIGDAEEHQPGGELHAVAPSAERDRGASEDPDEPDPEIEDDDQGTLPNELQEGVPPAPSTYPNMELRSPR
jgi:hypothetical protein